MRRLLFFATLVLFALPVAMLAAGGGISTGTSPKSSTSTVTVNIPSTVGIDVESDATFNFASYAAGAASPCADNAWPPFPGCTGLASYTPNSMSHTAGIVNPPVANGQLFISVFDNYTSGTLAITAQVAAAFSASPGFATTDLTYIAASGATYNPKGVGPGTATYFATSAANLSLGTLAHAFGWTRIDQIIGAVPGHTASIANTSDVPFQSCTTCTTTLTFTISD